MEPLVIVAILVLFSVLDAIARKQRRTGDTDGETATAPDARRPETLPDDPRSFDDEIEDEVRPRAATPGSSEELLPVDLWEEIRRLARGTAPTQPLPTPGSGRPRPAPGQGPRRPPPKPASPPASAEHPVHLTHGKMGRPMAERLTPLDRPGQGPSPSADVLAVRKMLTGGGRSALRRAIVLEEVLGPPAALRGDPYEPGG